VQLTEMELMVVVGAVPEATKTVVNVMWAVASGRGGQDVGEVLFVDNDGELCGKGGGLVQPRR
jgi:hypothetical protein